MAKVDLSIIIPSKNNQNKTAEIIHRLSKEIKDIEIEFIVIDMNSTDNSILAALDEIKNNKLRGCVIQSGNESIGSALNTGVYKSDGTYITFVYPSCLYKNYIGAYYRKIHDSNADFVFTATAQTDSAQKWDGISAEDLTLALAQSTVTIDFSAIMMRREYLLEHQICFYEETDCGYAEALIYHLMLFQPKIAYADMVLEKDVKNSMVKETSLSNSAYIDRIEALLSVYEVMKLCGENNKIKNIFQYYKLPSAVMFAIDHLIQENFSYSAIKNTMHQKKYDELLEVSKLTPPTLKNKIIKWKLFPWFYKP